MKELSDINLKAVIESETGLKFDRQNKICCPFHSEKTPSFSIRFDSNKSKWQWKCFGGCDASGDVIDFIKLFRNISFKEARVYLGLEENETEREKNFKRVSENIKNYWVNQRGFKFLGLFEYVDSKNNVVYFKAKLRDPIKKNNTAIYYHIDDNNKIQVNKKDIHNVPYNYFKLLEALREGKVVCIAEGEKDANTLRGLGFTATSFKGLSYDEYDNFDWNLFRDSKVLVFSDTGLAGEKQKLKIREYILSRAKSYKEINLRGINELGDNKDVTDWLASGHTKEDLQACIKGSLDLRNERELQQDFRGIYKTTFKTSKDGDANKEIVVITNFNILNANTFTNLDTLENKIELEIENKNYKKIVTGEFKMFVDPKNFETTIDSMRHSFIGNRPDLLRLKEWIANYFIDKEVEVYRNSGIREINGELVYITNHGALKADGTIDETLNVDTDTFNTNLTNLSDITTEELRELLIHLFNFNDPKIVYNCLGSEVSKLFNSFYKQVNTYNSHVTAYLGESSSGKTVTYNVVVKPLLNIGYKAMTCGSITSFNIRKASSESNTSPIVLDEHTIGKGLEKKLSDINGFLTELTGDYDFKRSSNIKMQHTFNPTSTLILIGETMPTAVSMVNRCNIMWFSKNITLSNPEYEDNIKWLSKNSILIEKLGFSLKRYILKNYNLDKFISEIEAIENTFKSSLEAREYNTFLNTLLGIKVLNDVILDRSNNRLNIPLDMIKVAEIIEDNIKENVCNGGDTTKADYSSILEKIDLLAGLSNPADETMKINMGYEFSFTRDDCINLDLTAIWPKLIKYNHMYSDDGLMNKNEFIKKLKSSSLVFGQTSKDYYKTIKLNNKSKKCYKLKLEELRKLDMPNLAPMKEDFGFEEVEVIKENYENTKFLW